MNRNVKWTEPQVSDVNVFCQSKHVPACKSMLDACMHVHHQHSSAFILDIGGDGSVLLFVCLF